jgi:hypothetical protein
MRMSSSVIPTLNAERIWRGIRTAGTRFARTTVLAIRSAVLPRFENCGLYYIPQPLASCLT